MNDPNGNPQVAVKPDGGTFDASNWDPPSGDISLDELFPNPELVPQGQAPIITQAPQTLSGDEFFLKAETGTVYKTREDAARGTAEKDRTIERLKHELAQRPAPHQPQGSTQTTVENFEQQFFDKLSAAASKGDAKAYANAMAEFQLAVLAPYAPLLVDVAKEKAIRANEFEAHDLRSFVDGPEFKETLERFPTLKAAVQMAENDPRVAHQLPEFYRLAYDSHISRKAIEANRQLAQNVPVHTTPTPSRPTLSPSTPTPIPNSGVTPTTPVSREQLLRDPVARKEFIERFRKERAGALDVSWESIGL